MIDTSGMSVVEDEMGGPQLVDSRGNTVLKVDDVVRHDGRDLEVSDVFQYDSASEPWVSGYYSDNHEGPATVRVWTLDSLS